MEDYKVKVTEELLELNGKRVKLQAALDKFKIIGSIENTNLLVEQLSVMEQYETILKKRLEIM